MEFPIKIMFLVLSIVIVIMFLLSVFNVINLAAIKGFPDLLARLTSGG